MRESDLQRAILETLSAKRIWAMRLNSGTMVVGSGAAQRRIRMCPPGTPDILVLRPYGFLEVKTKKGKLSDAQRAWHSMAESEGIRVQVVRSISDALGAVKRWEKEDNKTRQR
jgi:hypothetical protein